MLSLIIEFEFVRRTFLVGTMLAIAIPLLGVVMVNRRTSMMSDALSHISLSGVAIGIIAGFNPVVGAIISAVVGAFAIEIIRKRWPQYGDMATAVALSAGLGLAVVLSDLAPSGRSFESYLFGSLSAVTWGDTLATAVVFVIVVCASVFLYGSVLDIGIDPTMARLSGTHTGAVNACFTALAAMTVALSSKAIGALLVVSLMVLPVAAALMVCRTYFSTMVTSVVFGLVSMLAGISFSYSFDVRPGGAVVVVAVIGLLMCLAWSRFRTQKARGAKANAAAALADKDPLPA
ncbi:zinc ABC transporter permease [Corynebacterium atypicum]|uniref:Zinc ABC transporter permease n=1 Tax=Corynebacterium atypicum TaxID=191610 RepID=A0ABN4DD84_9CORY|nr:metal ABC transporter permease [Corynebacterium atypicum]AIG64410.1 zinc ABC transporter permease [Corynebacterium atypicum]